MEEEKFTRAINRQRTRIVNLSNTIYKHNYPILQYQEKFKSNYNLLKASLTSASANIINYKNEIKKLEDFLIFINSHEKNYKSVVKKFEGLQKHLEETISLEKKIEKLSTNQQLINMSEYVDLYNRVKKVINFFQDTQLQDKDDFVLNVRKMIYKGFKVYEESFYVILKRYEQIDSTKAENEKLNMLNKIRSLAQCLQDEDIGYDFTKTLISERSEKILQQMEKIKLDCPKNYNDENYIKNSSMISNLLQASIDLFKAERSYIYEILLECTDKLKSYVYSKIIHDALERTLLYLKDITFRHTKANIKKSDFYLNLDVIDIWTGRVNNSYRKYVQPYHQEFNDWIRSEVKQIEQFAYNYTKNFLDEITNLNEKIENENVLKICNDTIFLLSNFLNFEFAFEFIRNEYRNEYGRELSAETFVSTLINRMENKGGALDKRYPPLKFIFLINNVFFIQSKIILPPFSKYIPKSFTESLNTNIKNYIEGYLKSSWEKVREVTFDELDQGIIMIDQDTKALTNTYKEMIKKKFSIFNDTMKLNLKIQQHIQIIDRNIQNTLINENINYVAKRYEGLYTKCRNAGYLKVNDKFIQYSSADDVIQDLKMYFMPNVGNSSK